MPKKLSTTRARSGGRITAISGSRPTMIVSVWWRAWLQRHVAGIAHDHEARDLVDHVVHPARLEGRAVAGFVPARVAGGAVEHAVDEEERHAPPGAPEPDAAGRRQHHGAEPDDGVADGRPVGALHQLLHLLARHVGVIPLGRRKPGFHRPRGRSRPSGHNRASSWDLALHQRVPRARLSGLPRASHACGPVFLERLRRSLGLCPRLSGLSQS